MKSSIIPLALAAVMLTGCVSTKTIAVSSSSPVRATYEQGTAVLKSQKVSGVVVRVLTAQFTKETNALPAFYIVVSNGSEKETDFSAANVTAFSGKDRVGVYTFEEMEKKIKREAAMMAFALAMNSASQSMAASMPQTTQSSGSVYATGPGGSARAVYSGTTTTYNPAAASAAQAQINAQTMGQMSVVASARDIQLNNLGSMLRRNTLPPGAFVGGVVKLHAEDIRSGEPLKLVVALAGDSHEFVFDIGK